MKNFQREGGPKKESAWKGKKKETKGAFGSRDGARPDMHKATCAKCGKDCDVPFRPNGKRPVYCSICFDKTGGPPSFDSARGKPSYGDRGDRGDRRDAPRAGMDTRAIEQQLKTINEKLDALIDALAGDDEDFEGEEDDEDEEEDQEETNE